ncbi:MAG: cupin domain-containing protein [Gammaproteobacteria bacterium]|nr:cupin domain-containing protein [Gammaproteobacteria bacterium]MBQ0839232.1 cupin domain-containing protein [Gammaproteobacteria bacterium]
MTAQNIFTLIPDELEQELVEQLIDNKSIRIQRIVSKGHTSPTSGWYDQQRNEWVMVIKGAAILIFEDDDELRLNTGDYVNIPAHKKHRVSWTDPESETVWLAVHYPP